MLFKLSRFVPVRFRSTYEVVEEFGGRDSITRRESASWWQFRGHIFGHRRAVV